MYDPGMINLTKSQRERLARFLQCRTPPVIDPERYFLLLNGLTEIIRDDELATIERLGDLRLIFPSAIV